MHPFVHCSVIYNNQDMEATQVPINGTWLKSLRVAEELWYTQGLSRKHPVMHYEKETFTEEGTRYKKHCTKDNDTSIPFKVGTLGPHSSPNCHQLPHCIFLNLIDSLKSLHFQR